jgi:DNA repair exonuclease SbcCD ATPase subunit
MNFRQQLERKKGRRESIQESISVINTGIRRSTIIINNAEQALVLLQLAAKLTQEKLEYRISEICTLALSSIFPEPYTLTVDFLEKHNKTVAEISFDLNGNKVNPMMASGGGATIVAAFALRIALWSLQRPKSRPIIILDEPFKFINGEEYQIKASNLLLEISNRLNLQFIIVSQDKNLADAAHKVFEVKKIKGVSEVKEIQNND